MATVTANQESVIEVSVIEGWAPWFAISSKKSYSYYDKKMRKDNDEQRFEKMEDEKQKEELLNELLAGMTLDEKIGQMAQMDINALIEDDPSTPGAKRVNSTKAKQYIGEMGIGSVLNLMQGSGDQAWTAEDYRRISVDLQKIAKDHGRPPVIWGLDSKCQTLSLSIPNAWSNS